MLNAKLISRMAVAQRPETLLDALVANGLYLPGGIRFHVLEKGMVPVLALGLKRVAELSRRPEPLVAPLMEALMMEQAEDGSFEGDPVVTAIALAALLQIRPGQPGMDQSVLLACGRARKALAGMQREDGGWGDDSLVAGEAELVTAYILQLLARDAASRVMLKLDTVLETLTENRQGTMGRETQACLRIARASLPRMAAAA